MRSAVGWVLGVFGMALAPGAAHAFSIYDYQPLDGMVFAAVPAAATSICAAPCYEVRIFIADITRDLDIRAVQMDIDVGAGARVVTLPVTPAVNANTAPESATDQDE